ncbi:sugar-binding transcriptional regulator, partial [Microbacterium sp. gxy059]|uniref:sugar-binding transcriptional regulator n=1 Tax=Microbacterium sp. gxy059 TaxID=2957199 RepID=UPI003D9538E8
MSSLASSRPPGADDAARDLLSEVATRFYLDDESKVSIANDMGLSRFKVARLLQEARAQGIVEIVVHDTRDDAARLAEELRTRFRLRAVRLAPPDDDPEVERDGLGRAAAALLAERVREGQRIGLSWGRTLLSIPSHLGELPRAEFIQLTGVVGNDPSQSPVAFLDHLSRKSRSTGKALFAPLFCGSPESAAAQRAEPAVAEVMSLYDRLDIALLSVGSWSPRVTQLGQHISPADAKLLDEKGAVADFGGMFLDEHGRYLDVPLNACRLSVGVEHLARTPVVIAVAGQREKTRAISAVARSGLISDLVTTTEVARELLALPAP